MAKILGIEKDIIEGLIQLTCRCYPLAIKSSLYMEKQSRQTNLVGLYNLRDVLYHFYNILCDTSLNYATCKAQLNNAEEHFRRAIIEPYEILADTEIKNIHDNLPEYITEVIYEKKELQLDPHIEQEDINEKLGQFGDKIEKARSIKNRSVWDDNWEEAVILFSEVYREAKSLWQSMDMLIKTKKHVKQIELAEHSKKMIEKLQKRNFLWLILGAIFGASVSILSALFL